MTVFGGNPAQDMREMLLRFLGSFSHLQTVMDEVLARTFFEQRIPAAADVVWKRVVSRIKDEERVQLLRAIAAEVGSDADLTDFGQVYMEMKRLRDNAAHASGVQLIGPDLLHITKSFVTTDPGGDLTTLETDREELFDAVHRCRWLETQILYVVYSSGLSQALALGARPMAVIKPPRNPKGWNGVVFLDLTDPNRCTM